MTVERGAVTEVEPDICTYKHQTRELQFQLQSPPFSVPVTVVFLSVNTFMFVQTSQLPPPGTVAAVGQCTKIIN